MGHRSLVLEPKLCYLLIQHIVAVYLKVPCTVLLAKDIMENKTAIIPALLELIFYVERILGVQDKEC